MHFHPVALVRRQQRRKLTRGGGGRRWPAKHVEQVSSLRPRALSRSRRVQAQEVVKLGLSHCLSGRCHGVVQHQHVNHRSLSRLLLPRALRMLLCPRLTRRRLRAVRLFSFLVVIHAVVGLLAVDEGRRALVVDGSEVGEIPDEIFEESSFDQVRVVFNSWLVCQDNRLGCLRVGGEQTPVHVPAVSHVWVVRLMSDKREHALNHLLRDLRAFQEELHSRSEKLKLHCRRLFRETLEETVEQLARVVNSLSILADDPDHAGLGLRVVQRVQVLTESANDALVLVGVLAKDVSDHNDRFLYHVVHFGLNQSDEHVDASFCCSLKFDGTTPNAANCFANELTIDFSGVLHELHKNLFNVVLIG
mmetsp:Transcript_41246/g.129581  ORF Transcript_41246/g.129581 Transcript_41246/m.129581 type:complete len:361 (+) Transcript_41246:469-1551(+)